MEKTVNSIKLHPRSLVTAGEGFSPPLFVCIDVWRCSRCYEEEQVEKEEEEKEEEEEDITMNK